MCFFLLYSRVYNHLRWGTVGRVLVLLPILVRIVVEIGALGFPLGHIRLFCFKSAALALSNLAVQATSARSQNHREDFAIRDLSGWLRGLGIHS